MIAISSELHNVLRGDVPAAANGARLAHPRSCCKDERPPRRSKATFSQSSVSRAQRLESILMKHQVSSMKRS